VAVSVLALLFVVQGLTGGEYLVGNDAVMDLLHGPGAIAIHIVSGLQMIIAAVLWRVGGGPPRGCSSGPGPSPHGPPEHRGRTDRRGCASAPASGSMACDESGWKGNGWRWRSLTQRVDVRH
jgi:hypothetical protein